MMSLGKKWVRIPLAFAVVLFCMAGCGKTGNPGEEGTMAAASTGEESAKPAGAESSGADITKQGGADSHSESAVQGTVGSSDGKAGQGSVADSSVEPGTPSSGGSSASQSTASSSGASAGQGAASSSGASAGQNASTAGNTSSGQGTAPSSENKPTGQEAASASDSRSPAQSSSAQSNSAQGIFVSSGGALSVDGTKLVDSAGNPVQLKGISTHGLAWYPEYVDKECFRQLKEEWGVNVIRLAMYTAEYGGYCTGGNQNELKELVKSGVKYATECDMYAIIDWHILSDGNPNTYIEDAKKFFDEMSREYADSSNVLYEICNEPNGGTSWSDVKRYAEQIIEVIRANDEDGIILVGTPNWCQYVEQAAADPIEGYENIMYTLHFYAATHTDDLRGAMARAIDAKLPIFVSEYGICDASGNGAINEYQAGKWIDILNEYQVSYVAWNLSNKGETSAILKSSCKKQSRFTEEDLSDSGKWLYNMLGNTEALGQMGSSGTGTEQGTGNGAGSGTTPETGQCTTGNSGSGLEISAEIINSWGQGNETFYQYTLTLTNIAESDQDGWKISLVFSGDILLNGGWNGTYQVDGNTLTITSMDYNGKIEKNGSVGDIGFILQGADNLTIVWE